jgi:thioesterase domain-containing protein
VYLLLKQADIAGNIVLADGKIRYHAPVKGPATARINMDSVVGDISPLIKTDNELPKKARFNLSVQVLCGDEVVASFEGLYFVIPK